ncbi:MAG TPA: S8 family peptidase [Steroidobacteraceae bacterium]|nr:S8 family peptidase [Steroidobacteraceae bacterium]
MRLIAALLLSIGVALPAFGQSREDNGHVRSSRAQPPTDQIIVKWRDGAASARSGTRLQKLGAAAGIRMQHKQAIATDTEVLQLDRALDATEMSSVLDRMATDPNVEYAVADGHRWAHAVPSDPLFADQWYLQSVQLAATHADQAWDVTVGSSSTVVAVLDTGVRFEHPDLLRLAQAGKLLDGFDFVANTPFANDGNGRDADASDPGDFVTATERTQPPFNIAACTPDNGADHADSSWHGTRVASLIAALTNNGEGIAGTGWNTLILPVRVLGKCGGTDSDIIAGMRWAAGISVPGAPLNPTPAQIINLSLGGGSVCSAAYQSAVDEITARGVLIVASVGNDGGSISSPANCNGVFSVTGIRHAGTKVGFSNLGPGAGIGAPGGNCVNLSITPTTPCLFPITAAVNTGATTPGASSYTDHVQNYNVGTSFSAPLVAGAAALMHSLNSRLTPPQFIALLRETAAPFPTTSTTTTTVCHPPAGDLQQTECICTTQTCGAGMLDTRAAVLAAQRPFAIVQAPGSIAAGSAASIDGRTSFASNGRSITAFQWSAVGVTGAAPAFGDASQPLTTVQVASASSFTLRLTVTDDQGSQDTAEVALATPEPPQSPPTVPPASSGGGGGGGGGSVGWLMVAALALTSVLRRGRRDTR